MPRVGRQRQVVVLLLHPVDRVQDRVIRNPRELLHVRPARQVLGPHHRRPRLVAGTQPLPHHLEPTLGIRVLVVLDQHHDVRIRPVPLRQPDRRPVGPVHSVRRNAHPAVVKTLRALDDHLVAAARHVVQVLDHWTPALQADVVVAAAPVLEQPQRRLLPVHPVVADRVPRPPPAGHRQVAARVPALEQPVLLVVQDRPAFPRPRLHPVPLVRVPQRQHRVIPMLLRPAHRLHHIPPRLHIIQIQKKQSGADGKAPRIHVSHPTDLPRNSPLPAGLVIADVRLRRPA